MIVGDQQAEMAEKRGLLPTNTSDTPALPEPVVVEGLPAYAKDDPHTPDCKRLRKKKFWRAVKFCVGGFLLFHLLGAVARRVRYGFFFNGLRPGAFDSTDVTDEWVNGGFDDFLWDESGWPIDAAVAYRTRDGGWGGMPLYEEFSGDDAPDGPPHRHHGPPHGPPGPPPHGPPGPGHPPHGMPPHDGPRGPHHGMPPQWPMHPPERHHITVECVIDGDDFGDSLSLSVPFEPCKESSGPNDVNVEESTEWTDVSFNISASLPRIVLASRGPVAGKVHLSAEKSLSDDVTFDVSVSDPELIKVCKLKHRDEFFGVALIAERSHEHTNLKAIVNVYFPAAADDASIAAFTSHMGIFDHVVGDLSDIAFHKFQLGASNSDIKFEAITSDLAVLTTGNGAIKGGVIDGADHVVLASKNGAIEGVFPNVTGSLVLTTTNAHIEATATLWNTVDGEDVSVAQRHGKCGGKGKKVKGIFRKIRRWLHRRHHHKGKRPDEDDAEGRHSDGKHAKGKHAKGKHAGGKYAEKLSSKHGHKGGYVANKRGGTAFVASTSNGYININTALKSNTTGVFDVTTRTRNAHILAAVTEQPVNSTLSLSAHTSNNRVGVSLPAPFEGDFFCHTSNAKAQLTEKPDVKDPAGLERSRVLEEKNILGGMLTGYVSWGERKKRGTAVLTTSNAEVTLAL